MVDASSSCTVSTLLCCAHAHLGELCGSEVDVRPDTWNLGDGSLLDELELCSGIELKCTCDGMMYGSMELRCAKLGSSVVLITIS